MVPFRLLAIAFSLLTLVKPGLLPAADPGSGAAADSGGAPGDPAPGRWSAERAWRWLDRTGPVRGCNYLPRTAVNSTEMWQADTFDPRTIDEELGWARAAGYDGVRVFLQYVAWEADPDGFVNRLRRFLEIADRHGIRAAPIFFCDCAFAGREPYLGEQDDPVPGVHNSGWVPSPGFARVTDRAVWPSLERYVTSVVKAFADDPRILLWDLYNEPGNSGMGERSLPLAEAAFAWARSAGPSQPLTIGAWADFGDRMSRRLMELSDVVSFHGYDPADGIRRKLEICGGYGRPVLCTEWLHRQSGNAFATILPIFEERRVGWYHWGLVAGRTQTYFHWGSQKGSPPPAVWQHDVFHPDSRPYDSAEIELVRALAKPPALGPERLSTADIRIRDPFIVPAPEEGAYWMVGTGGPRGFQAWRSADLARWTGPTRAFDPPEGFWADRDFWAPEIHAWKGRWYLFGSFKSESRRRGTQILAADRIAGPYAPWSDGPVTPADRECLDGTLFVDGDGAPWMVFCHEWVQIGDGAVCAIRLTPDLKAPVGEPVDLFRASQAPWARPFGEGEKRVTDGPFLWPASTGELLMLWSSFRGRYALGVARSASGKLTGPWTHDPEPLFEDDGGHGMLFRTLSGDLRLVLHAPNGGGFERARILPIREIQGRLALEGKGRWTVASERLLADLEEGGRKPAWPGGTTGVTVDRTTGEAFVLVPGQGVWRTADRGESFERIDGGTIGGRSETGWAVHADPMGKRLACFMLDGPSGVTLDGGKTWSAFADMGRGWDHGAVDWTAERPAVIFAARHESGGELYLSEDLGRTWRKIGTEPKIQGVGVVDEGTLLLHRGAGIERSTDRGASWSRVSDLNPESRVAAVFGKAVWWVGAAGLIVSEDEGKTWRVRGNPVDAGMGPFFGREPGHLVVVGKKGFLETLDGGSTWTEAAPLPRPDCRVDWFGNFAWDPTGDIFWFANMGQPAWKLER